MELSATEVCSIFLKYTRALVSLKDVWILRQISSVNSAQLIYIIHNLGW